MTASAKVTAQATVDGTKATLSSNALTFSTGRKYGGIKLERAWFDITPLD